MNNTFNNVITPSPLHLSLAHFFDGISDRCHPAALESIVTLGALIRTINGAESWNGGSLCYRKNSVIFSKNGKDGQFKADLDSALTQFANHCDSFSMKLMHAIDNLFRLTMNFPLTLHISLNAQVGISALSKILNSNSLKIRMLGVKVWTALSSTEAGLATRENVIFRFPDVLPVANHPLRKQLSRAMPFEQDDMLRKLFVQRTSIHEIGLLSLRLLHAFGANIASRFWMEYVQKCASPEFSCHPIGHFLQEYKLDGLTYLQPDPLRGLSNIVNLCLVDHYRYIPGLLNRVAQEGPLQNNCLVYLEPVILLMEQMAGTSVLPCTARVSSHKTLQDPLTYIEEVVDSLAALSYGYYPLTKCSNADDSFSINPLDYITQYQLSPNLTLCLAYCFSRDSKFQNELINLFGVALRGDHPVINLCGILNFIRHSHLSMHSCLKLLKHIDPLNTSGHFQVQIEAFKIVLCKVKGPSKKRIIREKLSHFTGSAESFSNPTEKNKRSAQVNLLKRWIRCN
jgi:hypothetical protein